MATLPLRPKASAALLVRWGIIIGLLVLLIAFMTAMPLKSYSGPLQPLSPTETEIRANARRHVSALATTIGPRNTIQYKELLQASQYIEDAFKRLGYQVSPQEYEVDGRKVQNLVAEIPGTSRANEIVAVGAHYDTVFDSPGADDNATGVAALIELARIMRGNRPARTIRWVAFVNEEPPYFQTSNMGSVVYARQLHEAKEDIVAAVSLETIGMYSDEDRSQHYPVGFSLLYPSKGNFIGFVGNIGSRRLVREVIRSFREGSAFPSEGIAAPEWIAGIGWSDQWSFWQEGYRGVMVTDTAPFRNPNYHLQSDKPDTLDYDRMARVVQGLTKVIAKLGN